MKVKQVLYWLSIVRPIADILIGTWEGIKAAVQNAKASDYIDSKKQAVDALEPDDDNLRSFLDAQKGIGTKRDFDVIDDYFSKKGKKK